MDGLRSQENQEKVESWVDFDPLAMGENCSDHVIQSRDTGLSTMSKVKSPPRIRQFECCVKGTDWVKSIYALTRSKARYLYWQDVVEAWDEVKLTDVTARAVPIYASQGVRDVFKSRGIPEAFIGMTVHVNGQEGLIVGVNNSANLNVMFNAGTKQESIGNCHPHWETVYFGNLCEIVYDFRANKP